MSPAVNVARESHKRDALPWLTIAWFGVLLIVCYAPVLAGLIRNWGEDGDMGHGYFVPLVAGYVAWRKRDEFTGATGGISWWGMALVIFGAIQLYVATLGAELFLARTSLILTLAGTVLFLGGAANLKRFGFPLFLLVFMVPIPAVVYNQITFPLQILASQAAGAALNLIGIPVLREGNVLVLPSQSLSVAEACSGIRSLLSLTFLSLIYGYFFERRTWVRAILFFGTIPIAILANACRIVLTGVLSEVKPEWAEGFLHEVSGLVIFLTALTMMAAAHRVLVKATSRSHYG